MQEFFHQKYFGIEVWMYAASLASITLGFILQRLSNYLIKRVGEAAAKSRHRFDDILANSLVGPAGWFFGLGGIYAALRIIPIAKDAEVLRFLIDAAVRSATIGLGVWFGFRLIDGLGEYFGEKAAGTETKLDDQIVPILRRSTKVFLTIIGVVMVLQNLGYSVSGLVTGFGIGGAAIALASKDTLANLFGSLVIFIDQPFQVGDWIETGSIEGTVEEVGLRTTRIRTFPNSLVTMPNAAFTNTPINNWSRMKKRRIKTTIGATYGTPTRKLSQAVDKIREIIETDPKIDSSYYHVYFDSFGPSSLDILIYCFTVSTVWGEYLAAKQEFFLKVMKAFEELGIEFAFPTQTIHLAPGDEPPAE